MARRFRDIYLADHHAGSTAGLALARRAAVNNRGTATGEALERLVDEIAADRATLERLLVLFAARWWPRSSLLCGVSHRSPRQARVDYPPARFGRACPPRS